MSHPWLQRLPKLRLSHQILGFFVLVVLFPLLLLSFSIYSINQKAVKKQVSQFTEHTADATYEDLRLEMGWQQDQARLSGQYLMTILESQRSSTERVRRMKEFFGTYDDYQAVAFYNPKGERIALYTTPKPKLSKVELPTQLSTVSNDYGIHLEHTPALQKRDKIQYSLEIHLPGRLLRQEKTLGSVVFLKRFAYLDRLMNERYETFQQGFVIIDSTGRIIAGPPNMVDQKIAPSDWQLYRSMKPGRVQEFSTHHSMHNNTALTPEEDGPEVQKVFIKAPRFGWGIILESPYRIQKHFIMTARTQSVALVFLCIILIVVLGSLYSRGINRNFRQLTKGIKALGEGRYSRKIRLITKSWTPYEIVYLTAEFNRMAGKISSAWSSIQKLNQELVYKNQQDLFIAEATRRLHSSVNPQAVCETATQMLVERPDILGALLFLKTSTNNFELESQALQRLFCDPYEGALTPEDERAMSLCLALKECRYLPREQVSFLPENSRAALHPVYYQDVPMGVLLLVKSEQTAEIEGIFDDALMIDILCSQIGIALSQARQWHQLQQANVQLAKLDELKSNLIDTVSHELRTPLTNIKGYTSRLIRNEASLDAETKIKSLKVIKQQADRLGRLVEDLLVIPELEREEGIRVYPDRVDLRELIHRSVAFVQEKAHREIRTSETDNDVDVLVDPDRMEQVILNLLDNAIKYSPEGAVIEVASQFLPDRGIARLEVFNPCDPIAPEELAELFTKFKRLDERTTRTTRGTGLGLFITKGLIEAMSGKIRLDGSQGFRVIVDMPLYRDNTASSPSAQEEPSVPV